MLYLGYVFKNLLNLNHLALELQYNDLGENNNQ